MSLESFMRAWLIAEYVVASPERRFEMVRIAEQNDDNLYHEFMALSLPLRGEPTK